jgi:hypothetical protein
MAEELADVVRRALEAEGWRVHKRKASGPDMPISL